MRKTMMLLASASLFACNQPANDAPPADAETVEAAVTFDGADYGDDEAAKIAHGERISNVLLCKGCHTPELTGAHMGDFEEPLMGVYASNLTLALQDIDDAQLERLLREGVHPTRDEMWIMPSRLYQHVSEADMAALIAYLRTLEPTGEALPLTELNEGLAAAAEAGELKNSAEEIAHHAENLPADLGETHALGHYIATTVCADCHGATLMGESDFGPDLTVVGPMYDEAALTTLLSTGEGLDGRELGLMGFIGAELMSKLTDTERAAIVAYVKALGEAKATE